MRKSVRPRRRSPQALAWGEIWRHQAAQWHAGLCWKKRLFLIAVLQRVRQARVEVDGAVVGAIGPGLLVLVCAERGDTEAEAD